MTKALLVPPRIPILIYGVYLFAMGFIAAKTKLNTDQFLHLRVGDEIRSDRWSWSKNGHFSDLDNAVWQSTQPFSQVFISWLNDVWGLTGLQVLQVVVMLSIFSFVIYMGEKIATTSVTLLALISVTLVFLYPGWFAVRPMHVSFLFSGLVVWSWWQTARGVGKPWWTLVLFAIWPIIHGMWITGLALNLACALAVVTPSVLFRFKIGRTLVTSLGHHSLPDQSLKYLLHPLIAVAIILPQPFGVRGSLSFAERAGEFSNIINEFVPPFYKDKLLFFGCLIIWLALVAITLTRVMKKETVTILEWTLLLAGFACFTAMMRTVPLAMLILALPLMSNLTFVQSQIKFRKTSKIETRKPVSLRSLTVLFIVALFPLTFVGVDEHPILAKKWDATFAGMPKGTVVVSRDEATSWILWRHPQIALPVAGYTDAFTPDELVRADELTSYLWERKTQNQWLRALMEVRGEYAFYLADSDYGKAYEYLGWYRVFTDGIYELWRAPKL